MKDTIVLELKVDPLQGAARMAISMAPKGYRFESMERRRDKVKITYRRVVISDHQNEE